MSRWNNLLQTTETKDFSIVFYKYKDLIHKKTIALEKVGLEQEDCFQELCITLWKSYISFSPTHGVYETVFYEYCLNNTYKSLLKNYLINRPIKHLTCLFCSAIIPIYTKHKKCVECGKTERKIIYGQTEYLNIEIYSAAQEIEDKTGVNLFLTKLNKGLQRTVIKIINDQKLESADYKQIQRNKKQLNSIKRYLTL